MRKLKLIVATAIVTSLLGITSLAAITTSSKGVQKLDSADIVDALNNNADVLDGHIDKAATDTVLGHVKIANDLTTDDAETALSAAMGAKLNYDLKTISDSLGGLSFSAIEVGTVNGNEVLSAPLPEGFTGANTWIISGRILRTDGTSYVYGDDFSVGQFIINRSDNKVYFYPNDNTVTYCNGGYVSVALCRE